MKGPSTSGASIHTLRDAVQSGLLDAVISGDLPSFQHSRTLTKRFGMVQFAREQEPDLSSGFCVDDNARALLAAILGLHLKEGFEDALVVGEAALGFLEHAQRSDGLFHNLTDAAGEFLDEVGSEDCFGRAIWACGVAVRCAPHETWRRRTQRLLEKSLRHVGTLEGLRPRAYAVLGLAAVLDPLKAALVPPLAGPLPDALKDAAQRLLVREAQRMHADFHAHATPDWQWWEDGLTWGNARPPEALLRAAAVTGETTFRQTGLRALEFLASLTQPAEIFAPIGNLGWYAKGGERAVYDQQPIEACAMTDMWLAAEQLTGEDRYHRKALEAFMWYLGANSDAIMMANTRTGGCYDGLKAGHVNGNMGAESTLSYVHAHAAVALATKKRPRP